jgi:alkanesulfonate monooxygenase SsuD/methylene tetrahydromethanopterin reductase-like flavin-dependent oxidoreductase (luciferase family)
VKFHWFHLMPYADLPEGFGDTNRSVWVDIDPGLYDPVKGHGMYNDYLDELEFAASVGFDGVCVNEHHSNGYGLMPSPNLMAATLARNTSDAAIVVMGNSLALYNPPVRVAEEMAMIDVISGGRLVAGFPVGTPMDTCFAYGVDPATLRERYHEAHDLIMRAWTSAEPFTFNGTYTKLRYVNPWPRPVQQPHPPVWIPGGGSIDTWEWCAETGYNYSYLSYFGYLAGKATMDGFWAKMAELGKEPNPYQAGFIQFVGLADTDEEAVELYREPAEYFYHRCLHVYPGFADPPGYKSEGTVRAGVMSQIEAAAKMAEMAHRAGQSASKLLTYEQMLQAGYIVVGSPNTVIEKIREVATSLNVGHLMVLLQFGNMGKDLTRMNTELFARHVIPELHGLFDDQWEDRWYPNPLPAEHRTRRDDAFVSAPEAVRP